MSKFITNSFQVPNAFVDEAMFELSGNAVKCYLFIMRKTLGWQKEWDYIPTTQFHLITGIKKPLTVYDAIKELESYGLLRVIKERGKISGYAINLELDELNKSSNDESTIQKGHTELSKKDTTFDESTIQNGNTSKDSIKYNNKNTILSSSVEDAVPEIKTNIKRNTKPKAPVNDIYNAYNEVLGDKLPRALILTDARKREIAARWNELLNTEHKGKLRYSGVEDGINWWNRLFAKVTLCPHWMGENDRGWRADLDWIINKKNFIKVLEYVPNNKK